MALAVTESRRLLLMKNYIWDFDGMLFDSYPHITAAFMQVMKDNGLQADYDEAKALFEISFGTAYNHYGLTEEMRAEHHRYDRMYELEPPVVPFENTYRTLETLYNSGAKHYLYTHRGHITSQYYLEKYDMLKFFSGFVDSDMNFPLKPAPDALNYLCETYGLDKSESVMIGDREIDVAAGKNAGMKGCLYTKEKSPVTVADYVVGNIIEVTEI